MKNQINNIKMTKRIIYSFMAVLTLVITLNSCVKDTDYDTPQITCEFNESDLGGTEIAIGTIIESWEVLNAGSSIDLPIEFDFDDTGYISGYVVSNDQTGNFYKELYIQDSPTDPTIAIKVGVNVSSLFTKYDMGRKIFIKLKDLALTKSHGEMFLGQMINSQVDEMNESIAKKNIFRNCESVEIAPKIIESPSAVTSDFIGMFIQLDNIQIAIDQTGSTFVNPNDDFDTHISMLNCFDFSSIMLETSSFSSFKNETVPQGNGSVKGILTRDYGDDFFVLRVNKVADFSFDGERCGPTALDCSNTNIGGPNVVFYDDFESYATNTTNIAGWTNINMNGGNELYEIKSYDTKYVQCSAYNCGETPLEVWLITPAINLDASTDEALTFKTKTGYNNGEALSVYVSTDYAGDVNAASWMWVDATIANGPSNAYESEFTDSGSIDVSCLEGNLYVAFRYLGGAEGITTTFQIDDVKITGN